MNVVRGTICNRKLGDLRGEVANVIAARYHEGRSMHIKGVCSLIENKFCHKYGGSTGDGVQ